MFKVIKKYMLLLVFLIPISNVSAENCIPKYQKDAIDFKSLQIDFMVYSVNCKQSNMYKAFYRKFAGLISYQDSILNSFFKTQNNKLNLDKFVTKLANIAVINNTQQDNYCEISHGLFKTILESNNLDLINISAGNRFSKLHNYNGCYY